MKNFKQIRLVEKSVKGITIPRYLVNPTPNEMAAFITKSKYKGIRLFTYDKTLFAWESDEVIHAHFVQRELRYEYDGKAMEAFKDNKYTLYCGLVSVGDEYSFIGNTLHKDHPEIIDTLFGILEDRHNGVFDGDEEENGSGVHLASAFYFEEKKTVI